MLIEFVLCLYDLFRPLIKDHQNLNERFGAFSPVFAAIAKCVL